MCLIIKGRQKCSGACVCMCVRLCVRVCVPLWDWLLSSQVYGFMRGAWYCTTYRLIGHRNNDIVATGRRLQITGRLEVCKRVDTGMGVYLCVCVQGRQKEMLVCKILKV